jgi:hypothetical protein
MERAILLQVDDITVKKSRILKDYHKIFQISNRGDLVNAHKVMFDEVGLPNVAVQHSYQPDGKPHP